MNKPICFFILILLPFTLFAQEIEVLSHHEGLSIRGLSVVNENIIWVSGTGGTVGKSTDAGKTWQWMTVKDFEKRDFRDLEAFDENTAIIMAVAEPAQILKTTDGGKNWRIVFTDSTKGMFLDAMDFAGDSVGIVVGDPIDNHAFIAFTKDQGDKWIIALNGPSLDSGEALFAASGTNIKLFWDKKLKAADFLFVTGGVHSRFFFHDEGMEIPIIQGKQTTGANSVAFDPESMRGVIVGGDFSHDTSRKLNCALFLLPNDKKPFFHLPLSSPHGYRSCVEFISSQRLIACGTTGVDISEDGGNSWKLISKLGFHACRKARHGELVILAGADGRIARLKW
ncbi:MAG TPA: oxidoreductase [Puia sp.]|nr:oxidoreductase [Puia sp.]